MGIVHILTIIYLSLLSRVWLSMFCKAHKRVDLTWPWEVESLISCSFLHSQHSAMSVEVLASVVVVVSFIFISSNWIPEPVTATVSPVSFHKITHHQRRSSWTVTDVSLVHKSSQSDIPTAVMIAKPCLHWSHPDWCFPGVYLYWSEDWERYKLLVNCWPLCSVWWLWRPRSVKAFSMCEENKFICYGSGSSQHFLGPS